ncbi:MAG TPA: hypothetical protein VD861_12700 [Pyrinomonadaceae bacterium]|jgi:hypothetical protein|nr:hypothetical protein [Pyrinomonadaceae bacterium]
MLKKFLSLALVVLVLNLGNAARVSAATKGEKEARLAAKVRAGVMKLGTGPEARVRVRLRDKTKAEGYVARAGEEGFVLVNAKTGAETEIAYSQVKQIKGNNLSTGAKIAIGLGILAAVIILGVIVLDDH